MPPVQEPIAAAHDTATYVNFLHLGHYDVLTYVNIPPGVAHDTPSSVTFPYRHDTPTYTNFINFNQHHDTPTYVNFMVFEVSLPSYVIFTIPAHTDIPSSVTFPYYYSLPSSATFVQSDEVNLPSTVTFYQKYDIPSSATFFAPNHYDLVSYAFFGSFHKDIQSQVAFTQFSHKDFPATVQINQSTSQKTTLLAPAQVDIPSTVNFHALSTYDLSALVVFTQFGVKDFPATVMISNSQAGAGNVGVVVQSGSGTGSNSSTSSLSPSPSSPPIQNNAINVDTDATGYFSINNLAPGNYTIIPHYGNLVFNPPAFEVTIVDANVELHFDASGDLVNEVATASVLPTAPTGLMCLINTEPTGNVGTFSIEGYIALKFDNENYESLMVIITEEDLARGFRHTLPNNYGGIQ